MRVYDELKKPSGPCAIAIGTFDGVHLGHQAVIRRAVEISVERGLIPTALTFQNHPLSVLAPLEAPPRVDTPRIRRKIMSELGVSALFELKFTQEIAREEPGEFLASLVAALNVRHIVVGENFSFGAGGKGNPDFLGTFGEKYGFRLTVAPLLHINGDAVSSTRIREFLARGEVSRANEFLGRVFEIEGAVEHGDERGRTLGFPTANIAVNEKNAAPKNGAYAVQVTVDGKRFHGMANIGRNPTFGGAIRRVEAHLFDFSGDLYGRNISVGFISRLRDERRFSSAGELAAQLAEDKGRATEILRANSCRTGENA